ncbi:MAG: tetratricopeptide repeat protein [Deltaproteobacteria bacterium]|nr:tetratricopeptide repeat protein [Deltaproteobacteria bacterium]
MIIQKKVAVLIIFTVSALVYINTLPNDFVRDDKGFILENIWITDVRYIPDMLTSAVWDFNQRPGVSNQYRPLYHIYFMLGYAMSGKEPWGYHIVNIVFHALSAVFVFLITFNLMNKGNGSALIWPLFAALLFALHPINTEPVSWVSAISELSFALFFFISLYLYIRSADGHYVRYIGSVFFFFLSACSKETAVTLPLLLFAYDYFIRERRITAIVKALMPFALAGTVYLAARLWVLGALIPLKAGHVAGLTPVQVLLNIPPLVIKYLSKLILPIGLNFDYVFTPVHRLFEPRAAGALMAIAFLVILGTAIRKRDKTAFLAFLWISIPLLPALYIPGLGENTFTERYMYVSSAGFSLMVSIMVRNLKPKAVVAAFMLAIIVFYSIQTVSRTFDWRNGYTLWKDTVIKSPSSRIARNNYGNELAARGLLDEAMDQYKTTINIAPDSPAGYNNLGIIYAQRGDYRSAIACFQKVLELNPANLEARKNLERALKLVETQDR